MDDYYEQGFIEKCAQHNVNPHALVDFGKKAGMWGDMWDTASNAVGSIANTASNAAGNIANTAGKHWDKGVADAKAYGTNMVADGIGAVSDFQNSVNNTVDNTRDSIATAAGNALHGGQQAMNSAGQMVDRAGKQINKQVADIGAYTTNMDANAANALYNGANSLANLGGKQLLDGTVGNAISNGIDNTRDSIATAAGNALHGAQQIGGQIQQGANQVGQAIGNGVRRGGMHIDKGIADLQAGATNMVADGLGAVHNAVSGVANLGGKQLLDGINQGRNGVPAKAQPKPQAKKTLSNTAKPVTNKATTGPSAVVNNKPAAKPVTNKATTGPSAVVNNKPAAKPVTNKATTGPSAVVNNKPAAKPGGFSLSGTPDLSNAMDGFKPSTPKAPTSGPALASHSNGPQFTPGGGSNGLAGGSYSDDDL